MTDRTEQGPEIVRNPDGSLTYHRIPQTVGEAVEMINDMPATLEEGEGS